MNNKAHLRPKDFDSNGDIIPMACKEEKGDLISRKWLTDAIRNRRTYLSYEDAKDVIDLIDNAPTIKPYCYFCGQAEHGREVERPQGEWIMDREHTKNPLLWYKCNLCGVYHSPTHFCPQCGAKMKGGADNDTL